MDHNGVVIGVEDDDLQQTPITVGSDDENPIDAGNGSEGVTYVATGWPWR